jgi:isoleucyl-tRNA synthetase
VIGKSLEAGVVLFDFRENERYRAALPELFNVSEVQFLYVQTNDPNYVAPPEVLRSTRPKCERCWRYVADVAQDVRFPTVCLRCAEALEAIGFPPYDAPPSQPTA